MQITPIGLVIADITKNSSYLIVVIPAIRHKASSGNNGNKNAIVKKNFPLLFNTEAYFRALSLPTIHATSRNPNVLPNVNESILPESTAIIHSTDVNNGPYIITPVNTIIIDGIGTNITCNNCISENTIIP